MVQKYQSLVRVYKHPFELIMTINFLQNKHKIHIQGIDLPDPVATFQELEQEYKINSRLLQNILGGGFHIPTPIQMQAIPVMLHIHRKLGTGFRIHMIHKAAAAAKKFGPKSSKKFVDESDKLFEDGKTGFRDQLASIFLACTSPKVRRAMFSATFAYDVEQWCKLNLDSVITVSIGARNSAAETVEQELLFVGSETGKLLAMRELIKKKIPVTLLQELSVIKSRYQTLCACFKPIADEQNVTKSRICATFNKTVTMIQELQKQTDLELSPLTEENCCTAIKISHVRLMKKETCKKDL